MTQSLTSSWLGLSMSKIRSRWHWKKSFRLKVWGVGSVFDTVGIQPSRFQLASLDRMWVLSTRFSNPWIWFYCLQKVLHLLQAGPAGSGSGSALKVFISHPFRLSKPKTTPIHLIGSCLEPKVLTFGWRRLLLTAGARRQSTIGTDIGNLEWHWVFCVI